MSIKSKNGKIKYWNFRLYAIAPNIEIIISEVNSIILSAIITGDVILIWNWNFDLSKYDFNNSPSLPGLKLILNPAKKIITESYLGINILISLR